MRVQTQPAVSDADFRQWWASHRAQATPHDEGNYAAIAYQQAARYRAAIDQSALNQMNFYSVGQNAALNQAQQYQRIPDWWAKPRQQALRAVASGVREWLPGDPVLGDPPRGEWDTCYTAALNEVAQSGANGA